MSSALVEKLTAEGGGESAGTPNISGFLEQELSTLIPQSS
jgi:hypothetical protein